MSHWRLLLHPAYDGATNMAIDQTIMEAAGEKRVPPTLRFYAWTPACLSLGYAQLSREVDLERLRAQGWHLVRRATGGKAILHTDELTYSIAFPQDDPVVAGGILPSYRRLSEALLVGLQALGVEVEAMPLLENAPLTGPVCFEVPSNYEITFQGRKLIGSAQVRRAEAVLQHGSVPLHGDVARICEALGFADEEERAAAKTRVRGRATTIEQALGEAIPWEQVALALAEAFSVVFEVELEAAELTEQEARRADDLRRSTYSHPSWNLRR